MSADVVAAAPTVILELPQRQVWALIDWSATFARNLLRVLAGRVRHDQTVLAESSGARQGESFEVLVGRADAALFRAKVAGRNRVSD